MAEAAAATSVDAFRPGFLEARAKAAAGGLSSSRAPSPYRTSVQSLAGTGGAVVPVEISVRVGNDPGSVSEDFATVTGEWHEVNGADPNNVKFGSFTANPMGSGRYTAKIPYTPTANRTQENLKAMCDAADKALGVLCAAVDLSGKRLNAACLLFLRSATPQGVAAAAVCEVAVIVVQQGCEIHSRGDNLCKLVTKAIDLHASPATKIGVEVTASGPDFHQTRSGSGVEPFAEPIRVDFLFPVLLKVLTDPFDPAPYQGYNAVAQLTPGKGGFDVAMYMSGTDGYTQSDHGVTNSAGQFRMFVPGAVPGVVDMIQATAAGQQRSTTITF